MMSSSSQSGTALIAAGAVAAVLGLAYRSWTRYAKSCRVVGLFIYPVKGLRGNQVDSVQALQRGFKHDRRFMVVDEEGNFVTQREMPRMATVKTEIIDDTVLRLTAEDGATINVSNWCEGPRRTVRVWRSMVDNAIDQGDAVGTFLSQALQSRPLRLVFMDEEAHRAVNPETVEGHEVSFADGYPFLVASTSSLAELNRRIVANGGEAVPMERFRPNVVVEGLYPFIEDINGTRLVFRDSGAVLRFVKPCDRCKVTTTDQSTGKLNAKGEPLKTMRTFRRIKGGAEVFFATNAVLEKAGNGKPVTVGEVDIEWFPSEPLKAVSA